MVIYMCVQDGRKGKGLSGKRGVSPVRSECVSMLNQRWVEWKTSRALEGTGDRIARTQVHHDAGLPRHKNPGTLS